MQSELTFRFANDDDHAVVVALLGSLVDELGPQETARAHQDAAG